MHEFAEEYVANLAPREERYDTRLGDDFYVGTFPNGIKTWIYVFEVNGYTRRQTLGVYPEMPLSKALDSLYGARRTRQVEHELAEQGLDDSQSRQAEDSPVNLDTRSRQPRFGQLRPDWRFVAGAGTGSMLTAAAAVAIFFSLPTPEPAPVAATPAQIASPAELPVSAPPPVASVTPVAKPQPSSSPGFVPPLPAFDARLTAAQGPVKALDLSGTDSATDLTVDTTRPPPLTQSQQAVIQLQQDLSGTLAWSQLTSRIRRGEPVDNLGWIVEVDDAPRQVFFFVRVRGMAGDQVTYRWRHEGELVKEEQVKVGQGWHSPAFSSVTLSAARLGQWQVEVLGPQANSLGVEQFETRIATPQVMSRR